jgi:UDP-N-acetylmuramate--alanine ligase
MTESGSAMDAAHALGGEDTITDSPTRVWLHFVGVAGSGMSALAQFHVQGGGRATGSDRAFDQGLHPGIRAALEGAGVEIVPQDGSGLDAGCAEVITSTAVEAQIADVVRARALGLPIRHRSELLAEYVAGHRALAVTGTSGKSTTTAMIWTILEGSGRSPGLLTGGALRALQERGLLGNAWRGGGGDRGLSGSQGNGDAPPQAKASGGRDSAGGLLVMEADESDGSVVRYRPWTGVVLNLARDHKEVEVVAEMFSTFRENCSGPFVVGEEPNLDFLRPGAVTFGLGEGADVRGRDLVLGPRSVAFSVHGIPFRVPWPGRHTVLNALAAIAACREAGVALAEMVAPLAGFRGVERRFVSLGTGAGVEVIDDFAHNPDKLSAAIRTGHQRLGEREKEGKAHQRLGDRKKEGKAAEGGGAPGAGGGGESEERTEAGVGVGVGEGGGERREGGRVLGVFQPHGFGPTRFLRADLVASLASALEPRDVLWMPEIFYGGGTVTKDISSADLVADLQARGRDARFAARRADLPSLIAAEARPGDLVLVMGARDPSLTGLGEAILAALMASEAGQVG